MKPARDCAVRCLVALDLLLFLFPFPPTFLERQSARTRNRIVPAACYDLDLDPAARISFDLKRTIIYASSLSRLRLGCSILIAAGVVVTKENSDIPHLYPVVYILAATSCITLRIVNGAILGWRAGS
ncbi:uncharacterized protein ARMOST_19061 [Armillaria ostoyae]|uniref:Uncharacterized protein n=1 Tax=Armillaria ostoyae TaxID=47428 RepID=A0A284S3G9_ARMOS|nr:uncharacterized protein ARMOST_19061 [Armillaria ostoyae]